MRDINEPLFTFKEKEMLPHAPTGMSLEDNRLSEISQRRTNTTRFHLFEVSKWSNVQKEKVEWWLPGWEMRETGGCGSMNLVPVMQDGKGLEICSTAVHRQY